MCGIAGLVGLATHVATPRVTEALHRVRHRGPDDDGCHEDDEAVLGMGRFSIIDVEGGHQPIYNEDGSIVVVCNGEIHNYVELLAALQARGHRFQSYSDVNVVALLNKTPQLSQKALAAYLRLGFVPDPWIYEGVWALSPGCSLSFAPGEAPTVSQYWDFGEPAPFRGSREDASEELERRLSGNQLRYVYAVMFPWGCRVAGLGDVRTGIPDYILLRLRDLSHPAFCPEC